MATTLSPCQTLRQRYSTDISTQQPTSLTAAQRVFGTVELLEKILVSIAEKERLSSADLRALLVTQRLNSTWRDLINRNTTIRQALCFAGQTPGDSSSASPPHWNTVIWPPRFEDYGIDAIKLFADKTVHGSWRKMLINPSAKDTFEVYAEVRNHQLNWFHADCDARVTVGEILKGLETEMARRPWVRRCRLTITISRKPHDLRLNAYFLK